MMIKSILLYFSLLPLLVLNAHALKLYLLSNHDNAGNRNQALGILTAFKKLSGQSVSCKDLNTKITPSSKIKYKIEKDLINEKVIIIGVGEEGIEGITNLPTNPNLIICLTSHMPLEGYKDPRLLEKVKFIALPTHVSADVKEHLGKKLIETTGVAHNRLPEDADKTYETWRKKELPECETYLAVILGGDAPTSSPIKTIKLFTKEDAVKLADFVFQRSNGACILVLNGPRTGKYDLNKNEILTVHRKGHSDSITQLFKERLTARGAKNIKIFDFQHSSPENKPWVSPYNSFELVVGAIRATNGEMIVPGDSTSVISETIDTLPLGKVLVYEDSAMNEVHHSHLASELKAGRIAVLKDYSIIKFPQPNSSQSQPNAAIIIAEKLWEEGFQANQ